QGHYRASRGTRVTGVHGAQSIKALAAARPLGPQPQASSGCQAPCFTFGLVSGRVNTIAFDPKNTSVAYLAQDGGGIWKTTNCCTPAYPAATGGSYPQYQAVGKVRVDPNNSNKVVVGTKTGLYFSYNGGTNWSGPCLTNSYTSQRQDITALILRDDGATTSVYA